MAKRKRNSPKRSPRAWELPKERRRSGYDRRIGKLARRAGRRVYAEPIVEMDAAEVAGIADVTVVSPRYAHPSTAAEPIIPSVATEAQRSA